MDVNQYVNNVKYITWILEVINIFDNKQKVPSYDKIMYARKRDSYV